MAIDQNLIGKGIIFPVELSAGKPVIRTGNTLIESSMKMILGWSNGERFFLPEFGSRLEELLEEPNDETLHSLIEYFIFEALKKWEPRIRVTNTSVVQTYPEKVGVLLEYTIVTSGNKESFIYPFYLNRLI